MARDEFDIDALVNDPALLARIRGTIDEAKSRVGDTVVNYRFVMQMLPESTALPSDDSMILIMAKAYADAIATWRGDMMLPMVFAVLTMKEIARGDI